MITNILYPCRGGGASRGGGGLARGGGLISSGSRSIGISGLSNGRTSISPFGFGGGKISTITSGFFAGRFAGGGDRNQIYGNRQYGSGYPGIRSLGVAGRGFPFYFWPLAWGGGFGYGAPYIHTSEYGNPDNSSRPGGPMYESTFVGKGSQNTTLYVIADNATVVALVQSIQTNCSSLLSNSTSATPVPYNYTNHSSPQPEQVVQYYRASSVALLMHGYNNTAALTGNQNQTDTPLPSNIDTNMLTCLNETIGASVPLVNGAHSLNWASGSRNTIVLVWIFWCLLKLLL